jgi:hypothetical protein
MMLEHHRVPHEGSCMIERNTPMTGAASSPETTASPSDLRRRAEAILSSLQAAKAACFQKLEQDNRADAMEHVTGASSFDRAIDSAQRTIETIDRAARQARSPHVVVGRARAGDREPAFVPVR